MGIHEGLRAWRRDAEAGVIKGQENELNFQDLVEKSRMQAQNYIKTNPNLVSVFISTGHRDLILESKNQLSAAKSIARSEAHLIPDTIEDLDHQAAFLIALAEELNKPEYHQ